jgi:hypothetical protein
MNNESEQLTRKIRLWSRRRKRAIKLAVDGTAPLRRMKTGSQDASEAFARAFYEWNLKDDKNANNQEDYSASLLPFEWCVEHYAGLKLWQWLPILEAIYSSLVDQKLKKANRRVYNDLDNNAYYIPHKEKRIMVWGSQSSKRLIVLQPSFIHGMCVHVRRIWPRRSMRYGFSNLWSLRSYTENNYNGKYGDCRDKGYILSYEGGQIHFTENNMCTKNPGKIDRAYSYWSEFADFMLDLRFLAQELELNIKELIRNKVT